MEQELEQLIESSDRILITSHISPDADAVSSLLLAGTTLKLNFPDKHVQMVLEEEPVGLEFINGYKQLRFTNLADELNNFKPNLLLLLDGNNYGRFSRHRANEVMDYIQAQDIKTAIIDHHEPNGRAATDVYYNQNSPATVQDVYELFFNSLGFKKPDDYAQTTMIGLYSDTGAFTYLNKRPRDTLSLISQLLAAGANVELIRNQTEQYTDEDITILAELAKNSSHGNDYNYSFMADEFVTEWVNSGKTAEQLHKGTDVFVNQFLRNIGKRRWGFIVYKNTIQGDNYYSASFRSMDNIKDVSAIAGKLGGGGHKPAAGAKFEAQSVNEAIDKITAAIASS